MGRVLSYSWDLWRSHEMKNSLSWGIRDLQWSFLLTRVWYYFLWSATWTSARVIYCWKCYLKANLDCHVDQFIYRFIYMYIFIFHIGTSFLTLIFAFIVSIESRSRLNDIEHFRVKPLRLRPCKSLFLWILERLIAISFGFHEFIVSIVRSTAECLTHAFDLNVPQDFVAEIHHGSRVIVGNRDNN